MNGVMIPQCLLRGHGDTPGRIGYPEGRDSMARQMPVLYHIQGDISGLSGEFLRLLAEGVLLLLREKP